MRVVHQTQNNLAIKIHILTLLISSMTSVFGYAANKAGSVKVPSNRIWYQLESKPFLSERAKRELRSGISTRIVVLAQLLELSGKLVQQQMITLETKYDLWEEVFVLKVSNGSELKIALQSELEAKIESPGPFEIGPRSFLKPGMQYRISTIETVNPVNAERLEAVQNWMNQQKLAGSGFPSGKEPVASGLDLETPMGSLFYKLWKRATSGEVLSGELRVERVSEFFNLEAFRNDPTKPIEVRVLR